MTNPNYKYFSIKLIKILFNRVVDQLLMQLTRKREQWRFRHVLWQVYQLETNL